MKKEQTILVIMIIACTIAGPLIQRRALARGAFSAGLNGPAAAASSPAQINNPANAASSSQNQERDAKDERFKAEQLRQNRIIAKATVYIAFFGGPEFSRCSDLRDSLD